MKKEIQYTSADDENGNTVLIDDAEKGRAYYCPECKGKFILRKSGKTGKGSRRPHFAHNNLSANCKPETVLHKSFKNLLFDLLERNRLESKPLILNWKCNGCGFDYSKSKLTTNLLAKTAVIRKEHDLKVCQPDIALLDPKGEVVAAIEVVVTHEPEENVLRYYQSKGITLIQINLISEDDLKKVEERIANPDTVNFCRNPNCPNHKNHEANTRFLFENKQCKRCHNPVKTCLVETKCVFGTLRRTISTENERIFAQSKGVRFKVKEDKKTKKKTFEISCLNCEKINEYIRLRNKRLRSRGPGPRL